MKNREIRTLVPVLIVTALLVAPVSATTLLEKNLEDRSVIVRLLNEHGNITIVPSSSHSLSVSGPSGTIVATQSENHLFLKVESSSDSDHAINIEVRVPEVELFEATTTTGSIQCTVFTDTPVHLGSKTGHITVTTLPSSDLSLTLATSGEITVDHSVEVAHHWDQEPAKRARITVGDGGTPIVIKSLRGNIRVLRSR